MKPGRELDKLVAKIVGYPGRIPPQYSTSSVKAIELFEWLEQNNPWDGSLIMGRLFRQQGFGPFIGRYGLDDVIAWGDTYPHAICLAILEVAKVIERK